MYVFTFITLKEKINIKSNNMKIIEVFYLTNGLFLKNKESEK